MVKWGSWLKDAYATLVGGDDVSRTAEELADHIEEKHEVVGEAVEKLAETAGELINGTIGTDGLGAAAKGAVEGVEDVVLSPPTSQTVGNMVKWGSWLKDAYATLVGGDDVSRTAEELADHIEEKHEVVGEAVEKLAETAGELINGTIGTDGLGAAAKWAVEGVEDVVLSPVQDVSRVVAEYGSEPAHTVARNVLEVSGGAAEGMPDVQLSSVDLALSELVANAEHDASEAVERFADSAGLEQAVSALAESTLEAVTDEAALELLDAALDAVPVLGQCLSAWKMLRGTTTATVGVGALAVSASIAVAAYVTANKSMKQAASRTAWWGASVTGEGTFMAAKGATNMANVVPGAQFIAFPLSVGFGIASSRCATVRSTRRAAAV